MLKLETLGKGGGYINQDSLKSRNMFFFSGTMYTNVVNTVIVCCCCCYW